MDYIKKLRETMMDYYQIDLEKASAIELHNVLGSVIMAAISSDWNKSRIAHESQRRAYYFSAEYLVGRSIFNNLHCLGILDDIRSMLSDIGVDINAMEEAEDEALGNGGLGRLAACFLDSAAAHELPLDGYGLRYRYGLFRQTIQDGYQNEQADNWQRYGDPWSRRRAADAVAVSFEGQTVRAVPYDMPVLGYGTEHVGTLRVWQSEPLDEEAFDFSAFNDQQYEQAVREKNLVENITRVLYPNDNTYAGKQLRLKQQYFLSSASLQDILRTYKHTHRNDLSKIAQDIAIQLNDTHPVVSIPEFVRLLMEERFTFDDALDTARNVFGYTNHTVMSEALEKWDVELFKSVIPEIFDIIHRINLRFCAELMQKGYPDVHSVSIIQGGLVHMANLAVYGSHCVNGVSEVHSKILQDRVLKDFYAIFPDHFTSVTNGVTQRRWLGLCNPGLAQFINERIGNGWELDLNEISRLKDFVADADVMEFNAIKLENKKRLCEHIARAEGIALPSDFLFDVQVKRMHEYKRQLLNAFSIMDIYFGLKEGRIRDFCPTVFLFGAKAAPGYFMAKKVIKYINEVANLVNSDPAVRDKIRVLFVANYNCSYAELIIPAADVSEQISTAGTEGSGTGNMKFMMNGAVTMGTMDGANIEIFEEAGLENNYCFGKTVEELNALKGSYQAQALYNGTPRIKKVLDTLQDNTFPAGRAGVFKDLFENLVHGYSYGISDPYFLLLELLPYVDRRLQSNRDYADRIAFGRKCLMNVACSGKFSSDRMLQEYAQRIWNITPVKGFSCNS